MVPTGTNSQTIISSNGGLFYAPSFFLPARLHTHAYSSLLRYVIFGNVDVFLMAPFFRHLEEVQHHLNQHDDLPGVIAVASLTAMLQAVSWRRLLHACLNEVALQSR
jgi:hypothetical protein